MALFLIGIFFLYNISDAYAQYNERLLSFESGTGLLYGQSARTLSRAHYAVGLQGLSIVQRKYFIAKGGDIDNSISNSTVLGVPVSVGVTNWFDILAGFYFINDIRPYKNESDIYQYYHAPEQGLGAVRFGLKMRLPMGVTERFQIAGKCIGVYNTAEKQIDGMVYRWAHKKSTDVEFSLLETLDIHSSVSLNLEQGYVLSGSSLFDDQLVFAAGCDIHPFNRWSFGFEIHNRTFMGVSPQSIIRAVYDPFAYWDSYAFLGDPARLKDDELNFSQDFFIAVPSISYRINESTTLTAGMALNLADQRGPREPVQFALGFTFTGAMRSLLDTDKDGVKDSKDRELTTPRGFPVNEYGISLDSDGDGVPDGCDTQPNTPKGATTDDRGVALDSDGDGVLNGIDKEPDTTNGYEVDAYGIALDDDGDGVPNSIDKELSTPKGFEVDEHGVALDDDGDGVPNSTDKEANSPKGYPVNENGVAITPPMKPAHIQPHPYSIHVSSFRSENRAINEVTVFKLRGYEAFAVFTTVPGKGDWYRVYVGRYATESEAREEAQILRNRGHANYTHVMKPE